jgi:hypothetical protein
MAIDDDPTNEICRVAIFEFHEELLECAQEPPSVPEGVPATREIAEVSSIRTEIPQGGKESWES